MPAIFSVGAFNSKTSISKFIFDCKVFFDDMLETYKIWYERAALRIKVHNNELEQIKGELLKTVEQIINEVTAEKN